MAKVDIIPSMVCIPLDRVIEAAEEMLTMGNTDAAQEFLSLVRGALREQRLRELQEAERVSVREGARG